MMYVGMCLVNGLLIGLCWEERNGLGAVFYGLLLLTVVCFEAVWIVSVWEQDQDAADLVRQQVDRDVERAARVASYKAPAPGPHGFAAQLDRRAHGRHLYEVKR